MNITKTISRFMTDKVGGIYIKNENTGKIVYADNLVKAAYEGLTEGEDASMYMSWEYDNSDYAKGEVITFDQYDVATKRFILVRIFIFDDDNVTYRIGNIVDVSSVMELSRDVAESAKFFREMNSFKTAVLKLLSKPFYMLIPTIEKYIDCKKAVIVRGFNDIYEWFTYDEGEYITTREPNVESAKAILTSDVGDIHTGGMFGEDNYECLLVGTVASTSYGLFVLKNPEAKAVLGANTFLVDNLKLYLENGFMREQIIFESEHDKMTGLYNKGKYLQRCKDEYPNLDSIGIINFDVNNLKKLNDTLGHEYGDMLLKRAADSIASICTKDYIHGYRMGGDEYLLVVANPKKGEMETLTLKWEENLKKLNEDAQLLEDENARFECIVARGVVYGEAPYDYAQLMHKGDELMYEDKKAKKKPGEEIR